MDPRSLQRQLSPSCILSLNDNALMSHIPHNMTPYEPQRGVLFQALPPVHRLARPHVAHGQPITATFEIEHPDSGELNVRPTTRGLAVDPLEFAGVGA
jgi:hypothetical protein